VERIAVFAYGSLVDPRSAALTLGREVGPPIPARLEGWRRRWSTFRDNRRVEKTFALADGTIPPFIVGLNLEEGAGSPPGPNGALLEVTRSELERLDLRELRYDRVEVTQVIQADEDFDRIHAYRAKREHFSPEPPRGAVVIGAYVRAVEAAFEELGPGALESFRESTEAPGVAIAEASLLRDRIPPGNPRDW
jgi:hypothetical protein